MWFKIRYNASMFSRVFLVVSYWPKSKDLTLKSITFGFLDKHPSCGASLLSTNQKKKKKKSEVVLLSKVIVHHSLLPTLLFNAELSYFLWICRTYDSLVAMGEYLAKYQNALNGKTFVQ